MLLLFLPLLLGALGSPAVSVQYTEWLKRETGVSRVAESLLRIILPTAAHLSHWPGVFRGSATAL